MSVNASYLAEAALIDLLFALAEISLSETTDAGILRAAEHIKSAMAGLKKIAPTFDGALDQAEVA